MTVRALFAGYAFLVLLGCSQVAKSPDNANLRAVLQQAGIQAAGSIEALYVERDERATADGHGFWLARLESAPALPGESVEILSASVLAVFEKQLGRGAVGTPLRETTGSSEWSAQNFSWRASVLSTKRGHFLSLERFK